MGELRLGDILDDFCIKCKRLTNHAIVSLVDGQVAKVRCRSCYHDHNYLHEIAPPSKKDLKKAELFNAVLNQKGDGAAPADDGAEALGDAPLAELDVEALVEAAEPESEPEPEPEPEPEEVAASEPVPARAAAKKTRGRTKKA